MSKKIPRKIHWFWAGAPMPSYAMENILSFLINTDASWELTLWVDALDRFEHAHFFKHHSDDVPLLIQRRLKIKLIDTILDDPEVYAQISSTLALEEQHAFPRPRDITNLKYIIQNHLVGVKNAAAAKDIFAHLLLFREGGYFLDLDHTAIRELDPLYEEQCNTHGFLCLNAGKIVSLFATEKNHIINSFALLSLLILHQKRMSKNLLNNFPGHYYLVPNNLRIRNNSEERSRVTCETSGSIIPSAINYWITKHLNQSSETFNYQSIAFQVKRDDEITLGIKLNFREDHSTWRKIEKEREVFDDSGNLHFISPPSSTSLPSERQELNPLTFSQKNADRIVAFPASVRKKMMNNTSSLELLVDELEIPLETLSDLEDLKLTLVLAEAENIKRLSIEASLSCHHLLSLETAVLSEILPHAYAVIYYINNFPLSIEDIFSLKKPIRIAILTGIDWVKDLIKKQVSFKQIIDADQIFIENITIICMIQPILVNAYFHGDLNERKAAYFLISNLSVRTVSNHIYDMWRNEKDTSQLYSNLQTLDKIAIKIAKIQFDYPEIKNQERCEAIRKINESLERAYNATLDRPSTASLELLPEVENICNSVRKSHAGFFKVNLNSSRLQGAIEAALREIKKVEPSPS